MTTSRRPHIVFCLCDQMRAFELGCYGHPVVRTPNIDRLAAAGTRFETAVTPNPLCTPARSCCMTGQYSRTCAGMLGNVHENPPNPVRERLRNTTLPEALRDAGYRTALVGKWHIDPQPQLIGFDTALYPRVEHYNYGQTYYDERGREHTPPGFHPDWEAERVDDLLGKQQGADQPLFLFYNLSLPHQPIGPGHMPERYLTMYGRDDVAFRPNVIPSPPDVCRRSWTLRDYDVDALTDEEAVAAYNEFWYRTYCTADFFWDWLYERPIHDKDRVPDGFDLADLTALYYGAISCVDDSVGALLTSLETHGLADDTIVVFASDHGDNLGSHALYGKGQLVEESIRVPLIVRDPHCSPRTNTAQVASLIDVMPTLLDLAGVPVPDSVQGQCLSPLVRGESESLPDNRAFVETGHLLGVRTPTHLYGTAFSEPERDIVHDQEVLYDLTADPIEEHNLIDDGAQAGPLRAALTQWDADTPWLSP